MKPCLFLAAIVTHLCSVLYPNVVLDYAASIISIAIIVLVFRSVKRFVQGLGVAFLLIGLILLAASGVPLNRYVLGFGNMLNILSLFCLIPLIAVPVELGRYADKVQSIIHRRVNQSGPLYVSTSFLSYILSSFMNVATLPMMFHMIRPSLDLYPIEWRSRFISRAITHGYSMTFLWTPVAPIVGIVVEMTGVSWSSLLPVVVPFSLLGLALDWLMGLWIARRRLKRLGQSAWEEVAAAKETAIQTKRQQALNAGEKAGHPLQIVMAVSAFIAVIFFLESYTHASFLLLVTLLVIPFSFLWCLLIGKGRAFVERGRKILPEQLLKMKEQFFVFLSAGFMIYAIQSTGASHSINAWITMVKDVLGPHIFLLVIPLIPLALAFIGLHPTVGLALTAESLNPESLGISVELTAIAMLIGASTAFMVGPYNATVGIMSNLVGESSYRVSNWNAPFASAYLLMAISFLYLLQIGG